MPNYVKGQFDVTQHIDTNGDPSVSYILKFFIWDTSTPQAVYSDSTGTALGTTVTMNSLGQPQTSGGTACDIFFDTSVVYKAQLYLSDGTTTVGPTIGPFYPLGINSHQIVDSFAAAQTTAFTGINIVETRSFYAYTPGTTRPKGKAKYYRGNTTGTASTAYSDNSGFYDANGDGFSLDKDQKITGYMFGAYADGSTDDVTYLGYAWDFCRTNALDLYLPSGTWICSAANFPFRQSGTPTSLLDCNNITVYGDGPSTILKTISVNGADVLQLNGLKNAHFRNLQTQATISGSSSGSNGVSITNGFDNVTVLDVYCKNMPSLDKTTFIDGGKAITIQPSTTVNECGSFVARIIADGCSYAVDVSLDLVTAATKKTSIDVNFTARDCYRAAIISCGAATGALSAEMYSGVKMRGIAVDCQQDVFLGRAHGCDIDVDVVTTKSIADRRLDPNGTAWLASDTEVSALKCTYAKNSRINVRGNKAACDYKARIGGSTAGSSGLTGSTQYCDINLDIMGTAVTSDIDAVNSGGNYMSDSKLTITKSTATSTPSAFNGLTQSNDIYIIGGDQGTFTAVLSDTSLSDEGATYTLRRGRWSKDSNRIDFDLYMNISGKGTLTAGDAAFITGLPFTSSSTGGDLGSCKVSYASGLTLSAAATVNARVLPNTSYITLSKWLATSTTGDTSLLISDIGTTATIVLSGSYYI